jgi:hypothetical protein
MAYYVKYREVIADYTTYTLREDHDDDGPRVARLGQVGEHHYAYVPDGVELPEQPEQIGAETVVPDDELLAALRAVSLQARQIDAWVVEQIRAEYALDDELKAQRLGIADPTDAYFVAYQAHVEACRAWGAERKQEIGL